MNTTVIRTKLNQTIHTHWQTCIELKKEALKRIWLASLVGAYCKAKQYPQNVVLARLARLLKIDSGGYAIASPFYVGRFIWQPERYAHLIELFDCKHSAHQTRDAALALIHSTPKFLIYTSDESMLADLMTLITKRASLFRMRKSTLV